MEEFLYYWELQQQLDKHMEQYGEPCTLYRAAWDLWKAGASHTVESLPTVSFSDWNIHNPDAFFELMYQTPVKFKSFLGKFQQEQHEYTPDNCLAPEICPLMMFTNEKQGNHRSDSFAIHYIVKGEAKLVYGERGFTIPTGTICIMSPHFQRNLIVAAGGLVMSIFLSEQTIDHTLHRLFQQDNILSEFFRTGLGGKKIGYQMFSLAGENDIRLIMRNIFNEYFSRKENYQHMCANYVEILLTQILRQCDDVVEQYTGQEERTGAPPMLAILKYIQNNYQTTSLREVAEEFHYEPSYLGRLLKQHVGKSYTTIVRELRVGEAKRLLCETELSMEKVAEQSGYNNQVHFFREFRVATGITPGEYRKQTLLGDEEKLTS